jgi:hypothetical protein
MEHSMTNKFAKFVVANPWKILLLSIVFIMAAASGGKHIEFTNDYRVFFSEDNPELLAFEEMQDTYTKTDNVLFVVAPKDGKVFSNKTLQLIEEMTEASWQIPFSTRVDSISNYQHTEAEEDDLIVEDLVIDAASLTEEQVKKS